MSGKLTDTHLEEIEAKGYVIVPEYYSGSNFMRCKRRNGECFLLGRMSRIIHRQTE